MIPVRNVKVKECCCGCTLRTGSLILLWIFLIVESIATLIYLTEILYSNRRYSSYSRSYYNDERSAVTMGFLTVRSFYYLITSIIGVIFSLLGIYGIQKDVPKYLSFGLYYIAYYIGYVIGCIIMVVFVPSEYSRLILNGQKFIIAGGSEFVFVAVVGYIFAIAAMVYFYVVFRSCRDSMMNNKASGRPNEIPDPSALGYSVA